MLDVLRRVLALEPAIDRRLTHIEALIDDTRTVVTGYPKAVGRRAVRKMHHRRANLDNVNTRTNTILKDRIICLSIRAAVKIRTSRERRYDGLRLSQDGQHNDSTQQGKHGRTLGYSPFEQRKKGQNPLKRLAAERIIVKNWMENRKPILDIKNRPSLCFSAMGKGPDVQ
jgi:hypothetical protein